MNTASLMEANGMPGRINVSETVAGHATAARQAPRREGVHGSGRDVCLLYAHGHDDGIAHCPCGDYARDHAVRCRRRFCLHSAARELPSGIRAL